jgi:hypothetical protein
MKLRTWHYGAGANEALQPADNPLRNSAAAKLGRSTPLTLASMLDTTFLSSFDIGSVNFLRVHFLLIYTFFLWSLNVIMPKTFQKWSILKSKIIKVIISGVISAQRLELTNGVSNLTTEISMVPKLSWI